MTDATSRTACRSARRRRAAALGGAFGRSDRRPHRTDNPFVVFGTSYDTSLAFLDLPAAAAQRRTACQHYSIRVAAINDQITQAGRKLEVIRQLAAADRSYWRLYAASASTWRSPQARIRTGAERSNSTGARPCRRGRRARDRGHRSERPGLDPRGHHHVGEQPAGPAARTQTHHEHAWLDIQEPLSLLPDHRPRAVAVPIQPEPLVSRALAGAWNARTGAATRRTFRPSSSARTRPPAVHARLPLLDRRSTWGAAPCANSQAWENDFGVGRWASRAGCPSATRPPRRACSAILTRLQRLSTGRRGRQSQGFSTPSTASELGWQKIMPRARPPSPPPHAHRRAEQFDAGARTNTDVLDASTRSPMRAWSEIRAVADYQIA